VTAGMQKAENRQYKEMLAANLQRLAAIVRP